MYYTEKLRSTEEQFLSAMVNAIS